MYINRRNFIKHSLSITMLPLATTFISSANSAQDDLKSISDKYFDLHVGIAGPAKILTLIKYAKICGVSATYIIAKNKNIGLRNLIKHNPTEIIDELKYYDNLHFFPFGGIKELINWKVRE